MTIQTDSNDPKVETKPAPAAEATLNVEKESETPEVEAEASAESTSTESETVENEEVIETEAESEDPDAVAAKDPKDPANKEPTKKKGGFQRRIDKLNAQTAAARRETEYWKQEAMKGKPAPVLDASKVEPAAPINNGKPDPKNFDTHDAYDEAKYVWRKNQEKAEQEQSILKNENQKRVQSYVEKRDVFKAKTPDFDEVMEDVEGVQLSPTIQDLILSSENGPELAYELAKKREDLARICKLSPIAAAREMGRLESKLSLISSSEKKTEPKTTKAPAPLAPVRGGGTSSIPKTAAEYAEAGNQAAYNKARDAELKKHRRQA